MQTLNLDALDRGRHSVEKDGVKYVVQPVTPRILSIIADAEEASGIARVTRLADAVAAILPDMPREMIDDFGLAQLTAVIRLAGTQVDAVEEYIADPNVPRSAVAKEPLPSKGRKGKKSASDAATSSDG